MSKKNKKTSHEQEVQQDIETPAAQISLADFIDFLEKNQDKIDKEPFDFVDLTEMIVFPSEQSDYLTAAIKKMSSLLASPTFTQAFNDYVSIKIFAEHNHLPEIEQLAAEIAQELRKIIDRPNSTEYHDYSVTELLQAGFNEDGTPKNELFEQVLTKARNRADRKTLPKLISNKEDYSITKPIDKISSVLFDALQQQQNDPNYISGQIGIEEALTIFELSEPTAIKSLSNNPDIYVSLSATFDGDLPAELSKKLTFDDEEVHDVVATMIKEGIKKTTLTHIYKRLYGKKARPSARDLKAIDNSLTKLGSCRVTIDNRKEIEANFDYPTYYDVTDNLIHYRAAHERTVINGMIVDGYIEFIGDDIPIMMKFAEARNNQITAVTTEQWAIPVRKTALTQALKRYLFRNIAAIKNGKLNNKMLYDTIFDHCPIGKNDRKARARAKEYISQMLEHWKKTNFIRNYVITEKGIVINPDKQQQIEAGKK